MASKSISLIDHRAGDAKLGRFRMRDRPVQAFEIPADAARLTFVLVDHENAGRLGRPIPSRNVDRAHAFSRSLALTQLVRDHLVLG